MKTPAGEGGREMEGDKSGENTPAEWFRRRAVSYGVTRRKTRGA